MRSVCAAALVGVLVLGGCARPDDGQTSQARGPEVAEQKNCVSCHTTSRADSVGPT